MSRLTSPFHSLATPHLGLVRSVKILAFVASLLIFAVVSLFGQPRGYDVYQEKRFTMEFRSQDREKVLGIELIVAKPNDDGRSAMQLLERQTGHKWSEFDTGDVFRFDPAARKWAFILRRDLSSTDPILGLKVSDLQIGDVIICVNGHYAW